MKIISIIIGIALISQITLFSVKTIESKKSSYAQSNDDQRIAADLSNATGISVGRILEIRNLGKTWNEVIERLKIENKDVSTDNLKNLLDTGVGDTFVKELISKGFDKEDIMQAKLLVERLQFQLSEILNSDNNADSNPEKNIEDSIGVVTTTSQNKEDLSEYKTIADKFDQAQAITMILALKKDFGSMEAALDEYLLSIQLDLNLEDYLKHKDKYQEAKQEKLKTFLKEVITLSKIEDKMLEMIEQSNEQNKNEAIINSDVNNNTQYDSSEDKVSVPKVENIKPKSPMDEINQEIKVINPN